MSRPLRFFGHRPFMTIGILLGIVAAGFLYLRNELTINRVTNLEAGLCQKNATPVECQELLSRLLQNAGKLQQEQLRELLNLSEEKMKPQNRVNRPKIKQTASKTPQRRSKRNSSPRRERQRVIPQKPSKPVTQPKNSPSPPKTTPQAPSKGNDSPKQQETPKPTIQPPIGPPITPPAPPVIQLPPLPIPPIPPIKAPEVKIEIK